MESIVAVVGYYSVVVDSVGLETFAAAAAAAGLGILANSAAPGLSAVRNDQMLESVVKIESSAVMEVSLVG